MTHAIGMLDFFVLEAGEYLERLDALAQAPAGSWGEAEEFVRIARAFRGSALMASQAPLARAAQGLEAIARALRDGRTAWDERVRGEVIRAVDDCKVLLRRVRVPADDDARRAEAVGAGLERLAGRTSAPARAAGLGLDAGARAFVAREAAAIASVLDRVGRALAADPRARDALAPVVPAMSALRGVAVLNDLPPLADVLVAVDGAVKEVLASAGAVPATVPRAFEAGARALARAAREVVDLGRPSPDGEDTAAFAALLLTAFARPADVRGVETLFFDDAGPHVVAAGAARDAPSGVELVSQGEFLASAAQALRHAAAPAVRDLRLFGLAATLRPLAGSRGSPLADALGRAADAARAAIDRGAAGGDSSAFADLVTEAADALRAAATGDPAALVARLDDTRARLETLAALAPAEPAEAGAPATAPPARHPEPAAGPLWPVEPTPEPAPIAIAAGGLSEAFETYDRLSAVHAIVPGPLDDLFGGAAPIEPATAPVLAPPAPAAVPVPEDGPIVDIDTLLFRGPAALRRAIALKSTLDARLAAGESDTPGTADLLREVFDLIQLGLNAD
jgi:hypothetical protein